MKTGTSRTRPLYPILLLALLGGAVTVSGQSNTPRQEFWVPDGPVHAILETNGVVYLGGRFNQVRPYTGSAVLLDLATAGSDPALPRVEGTVNVIVSDGSGGWFLGGSFTRVGGANRRNLAHITSNKTVNPTWNPSPTQPVYSLARSGGILYVGGEFTSISGAQRSAIAALDLVTGAVTPWDPNANGGALNGVYALTLSGSVVFAGGSFTNIGGATRSNLAALDPTSGLATDWNPSANGTVWTLAYAAGNVYMGGTFNRIGVQNRAYLAAVNEISGKPTAWNPSADNEVVALAIEGNTLYAGGRFRAIGTTPRDRLAAIDLTSGLATSWYADANGDVDTVVLSGNLVFAGGRFTTVGNQSRSHLAAVDLTTGQVSAWNPNVNSNVLALAASGGHLLAGGSFSSAGGVDRRNLCSLDRITGQPTAWNPGPDDQVLAMVSVGNLLYAGGRFTSIGGQSRAGLAALDPAGNATAWNPNASGPASPVSVYTLQCTPVSLLVAGSFTNIGGMSRNRVAGLDLATGLATGWDPNPDGDVLALLVNSNQVYAGGSFTNIGGQPRYRVASLDSTTGLARDWIANLNSNVFSLAVATNRVYVGGVFLRAGTSFRSYLSALNPTNGTALNWNPNVSSGFGTGPASVNSLALSSSNYIYVAGNFTSIGGSQRRHLALLNPTNAQATSWNPAPNTNVLTVTLAADTVYVGGAFTAIGGENRPYFAAFSPVTVVVPPVIVPSSLQFSPGGQFQFLVRAGAGETVVIQASTDLVTWQALATNGLAVGETEFLFVDLQSPGLSERFYRAAQ